MSDASITTSMLKRQLDILLVEDEPLIAMSTTDLLDVIGHRIVDVAPSLEAALLAIEAVQFDVALLDLKLGDDSSIPAADALRIAGKAYLFTTGYAANAVAPPHNDVPILSKPYTLAELEAALDHLFGGPSPINR